jgi:hypothetical protein
MRLLTQRFPAVPRGKFNTIPSFAAALPVKYAQSLSCSCLHAASLHLRAQESAFLQEPDAQRLPGWQSRSEEHMEPSGNTAVGSLQ